MTRRHLAWLGATIACSALLAAGAQAQGLPAVPATEPAHFREHSANLKRLRDQGVLVLGARYADKGLVVLQADAEQEAHAMMQATRRSTPGA